MSQEEIHHAAGVLDINAFEWKLLNEAKYHHHLFDGNLPMETFELNFLNGNFLMRQNINIAFRWKLLNGNLSMRKNPVHNNYHHH